MISNHNKTFKYLNVSHVINGFNKMVSITLSVPPEVKKHMEGFPEINWSEVARSAIKKKLVMLERFKAFSKDSTFTEEDALQFGSEVSRKATKRHKR